MGEFTDRFKETKLFSGFIVHCPSTGKVQLGHVLHQNQVFTPYKY